MTTKYDTLTKRDRERIARYLERSAQEIEKRGWTTGQFKDERTGHVCALGGLYAVKGFSTKPTIQIYPGYATSHLYTAQGAAEQVANDYVSEHEGYYDLADYNDHQRDRRKVTRLLRRVARKVRAGWKTSQV